MRTVAGAITTAEVGPVLVPRHEVIVRNERLAFAVTQHAANALLLTDVPQSFAMRVSGGVAGTHAYAASFGTDGSPYAHVVTLATPATWALDSGNVILTSPIGTMRPGVFTNTAGETWLYVARDNGAGAFKLQRCQLTGTTSPPTVSLADWGSAFGPAPDATSTVVRRVEAVCPTNNGVIVAVGVHRFDIDVSTITFYWFTPAGGSVQLNTIIQYPLIESPVSWWSPARWATWISAVSLESGTIVVVANAHPNGRAVTFRLRNGIESVLRPVVPTDLEDDVTSFVASSLSVINGQVYMCGRMTRRAVAGGVAQASGGLSFDCFLTSLEAGGGRDWSVGERSHFAALAACGGTLLLDANAHLVYYGGNGYSTSSPATLVQDAGATSQGLTVAGRVLPGWGVQQVSNAADSLDGLAFRNDDGTYTDHALLKKGATVKLRTGQESTLADFGEYVVTKVAGGKTETGEQAVKVAGLDAGCGVLLRWRSPLDLALRGRSILTLDGARLALQERLIQKTPVREDAASVVRQLTWDGVDGLTYQGLNDPAVIYFDEAASAPFQSDASDGLTKLVAQFEVDDDYHLSSVGVVIGGADDGTGLVFLLPKATAWTGHAQTKARMRRLSLNTVDPGAPDAVDTGWNLKARTNGLWESVVGAGSIRTTDVSGTYRTDVDLAAVIAPGVAYDVAVRVAGRRAQMWVKERDLTPANCADAAGYTLVSEFVFTEASGLMKPGPGPGAKWHGGLALGTDVFVDTEAFAHAVYDDVGLGLTSAEAPGASYYTTAMPGATYGWHVAPGGDDWVISNVTLSAGDKAMFAIGQRVRIHDTGGGWDHLATIDAIEWDRETTGGFHINNATGSGSIFALVYLASAEHHGQCASGVANYTEFGGAKRVRDPGAIKTLLILYGVGCILSNDNTALSIRKIESDGVIHRLMDAGWDATWPGGGGTDPNVWRLVFGHNQVAGYHVSEQHGLPETGHFLADEEPVRYVEETFELFAQLPQASYTQSVKWTLIPTYYTVVNGQGAPSPTLTYAGIGNDFAAITDPVGLLVELSGRSDTEQGFRLPDTSEPPPQLYVLSRASSVVTVGAYDEPFGAIGSYTPENAVKANDLVILSGRGQFGAKKSGHNPTAPVCYYPCDATGRPARILIGRVEQYRGAVQTVEDAIRRACSLAGMRKATFRQAFSTPTASITREITTTPYTIPFRENPVNFVLDLSIHIPANGTGTALLENRLNILFRSYYRLSIEQWNTAADIAAGRQGNLRVMLSTTSTDIDAPTSGDSRWLQYVTVPVTDYNFSGSYTGSSPNYTAVDDLATARNCPARLCVKDNLVSLELFGQPVWTFNLDELDDGAGHSYRVDTAGPVTIAYTQALADNSATLAAPELSGEVAHVDVPRGDTGRGVIDRLIGDARKPGSMRIRDIATVSGGRTFSQWWMRDDAGELRANLLKDDWMKSDEARTGHQQVTGLALGEALDEALIRAEGYSFDTEANDALETVWQCVEEARLALREQQEFAVQRGVSGYGRIALQPEDLVTRVYGTETAEDHVITSVKLTAEATAMKGQYELRKYMDTF